MAEKFWERTQKFLEMNPAAELPILEIGNDFIADKTAIAEFLEEKFPEIPMIHGSELQRGKIRRICNWFNYKFHQEVSRYVLEEKFIKFARNSHIEPSNEILRIARSNIKYHLEYINFLTKDQDFLVDDKISIADIAAASQISVMDYFGEVPWELYEQAKNWYGLMKSRPSVRKILKERITGFSAPSYYENPDF